MILIIVFTPRIESEITHFPGIFLSIFEDIKFCQVSIQKNSEKFDASLTLKLGINGFPKYSISISSPTVLVTGRGTFMINKGIFVSGSAPPSLRGSALPDETGPIRFQAATHFGTNRKVKYNLDNEINEMSNNNENNEVQKRKFIEITDIDVSDPKFEKTKNLDLL
ncbi:hypothetical protein RclHR1_18800002 [Rhizophagus clarus]|uniref:Uncharacterized protein n=1 Tax=Rhizophagus clarus TaxID=94130 RepID=A0A2Z6QN10_9GLOM|nr:hypothetical protein RclHR1_18800002 [Rhizophagus clarus]